MLTLLSILFLGFFLGMRHATDADHVIAVTTIVSREQTIRHATLIGIYWGIGHSLTMLLVGGTIILFGVVVPPRLGLSLEFSVAVMLIVLGVLNFRSFTRWLRQNADGDDAETDEHREEQALTAWLSGKPDRKNLLPNLRPLLVGIVHGLAGSAAVALLLLPIIQKPLWAICYLLIFGVGTIAGMMLITSAIALPFACSARRSPAFHRHLGFASSFLSVGFGLFLVYQIGFVEGLFSK